MTSYKSVAKMRLDIEMLSDRELEDKYELYRDLKSTGVKDEIMLMLLEDEMSNRLVLN
jgi:hypothetical protein